MDVLGVDFGNVIIDHWSFGTTPSYVESSDYNSIPPVSGSIDALRALHRSHFRDRIFIAYNATRIVDVKIEAWLLHHRFCENTGIPLQRILRSPGGRNKSELCLRFGATHFIDDRLEVLGQLGGIVRNRWLFRPSATEVGVCDAEDDEIVRLDSWELVLNRVMQPNA